MQALARVSPWTLALALLVFNASPAVATLIGQSLTVELISSNDGNLHLSDSLTAAGGLP